MNLTRMVEEGVLVILTTPVALKSLLPRNGVASRNTSSSEERSQEGGNDERSGLGSSYNGGMGGTGRTRNISDGKKKVVFKWPFSN